MRVVVGPQKSSEVAAVRRAATSLGVLVISQGSTAHSLAYASDNVFRFVPDDIREGEAVVALLRHDGVDAIVPVWRSDAGNAGLESSVRRKFLTTGGKVSKGVPYATKATAFKTVVSSISGQVNSVLSAASSHLILNILTRTEPLLPGVQLRQLVELLLGTQLDVFHPALHLLQMGSEVSENVAFAHLLNR